MENFEYEQNKFVKLSKSTEQFTQKQLKDKKFPTV